MREVIAPDPGHHHGVTDKRKRLVAAALLVGCLAGVTLALYRHGPAPANTDGTTQPSRKSSTLKAVAPSPSAAQATAWPTPLPPLPPLPTVVDESLALPEGVLVALRDDTGLWLHRGAEKVRKLLDSGRMGSFKLSPDGRWVAYEVSTESNGWDLWVVSTASGTPKQIVDAAELA